MNLLYLTFGNVPTIHLQTSFSAYSFLNRQGVDSVNIITDNVDFYKHLSPHVNIIELVQNDLTEWKGEHQYLWRIKIKAIEKICHLYPGEAVLYLDTDTFLFGDAGLVNNGLANGRAYMHDNEGPLSSKTTKTQKNMWRQISGKTFGSLVMLSSDRIWNAGVVGTPNTCNGKECELALNICDEMCKQGVTRHFIEQYSLSLALEKTYGLEEAKIAVAHYWSTKEIWTSKIHDFFIEAYFSKWDYERIIAQIQIFDIAKTPVFQKTKSVNVRLKRIIDRLFPPQNLQYPYRKSQKIFP